MYYCFGVLSLLVVLSAATPFNVNYPPARTLPGDNSNILCITVAVPSGEVAATRNPLILVYRRATTIVGGLNGSVSFVEENVVEVYDDANLELVQVIRVSPELCHLPTGCTCSAIVGPNLAVLIVLTGRKMRRFVVEFDVERIVLFESDFSLRNTETRVVHDALADGPYWWNSFITYQPNSVTYAVRVTWRRVLLIPELDSIGTLKAVRYNPFVGGFRIVGLDVVTDETTHSIWVVLVFENGYGCVLDTSRSYMPFYATNCKFLPFGRGKKSLPIIGTKANETTRIVTLSDNRAILEDLTSCFVSPLVFLEDQSTRQLLYSNVFTDAVDLGLDDASLIFQGTVIPQNTLHIYAKDYGTDHAAIYNLSTPLLEGQQYVFLVGGVKENTGDSGYSFQTPEVTLQNGESSTTLTSFIEVPRNRLFCPSSAGCEGSYLNALSFTPSQTGRYMLSRTLEAAVTHGYLLYMTKENYLPLLPSKKQDVLCCYSSDLDRAKTIQVGDKSRLVTHADDSSLQVWRLDELGEDFPLESVLQVRDSEGLQLDTESDFFVYETAPGETADFRVLAYSKGAAGGVYVFDVSLDATRSLYAIYILIFNYAVLVSLFTFTIFVCYYKARKPVERVANSGIPFGTRLLTVLGLYPSLRYFDVHRLKGFVTERFLRWLPVPRQSLALTVYLIFVLVMFSPNINPATATASTQCEHSAAKLEGIGRAALQDLNHDDARLKYEESIDSLTELTSQILRIRTNSNGALFSNWPNATEDTCEALIAAAYAEAKKQLTSECDAHISCEDAFLGLKGRIRDGIAFFFERSFEAFKRRFARIEEKCIPERGTKVPCEIDTSVITDLIAAQDLLTRYQEVPKQLPQTVERVEESIMQEIEYLLFLIALGNDLFIVFTIASIYLSVPLKLYRSSVTLRLQRVFFVTTQLKCKLSLMEVAVVIVVVVAMWTIPYIFELLSIENIRLFLHSTNTDSCYVQPSFLGTVATGILSTCSTMDRLQEQYYTVQYQLREMNVTANQYKDCSSDILYGSLSNIFEQLDAATRAVDEPFTGRICDQVVMGELRRKFSVAPGEVPTDVVTFIYALAFLCRIFGAFILARFGLSFTNVFAPILLHDGQVEAEKQAKLPSTRQVKRFFSAQRFPGFVVDSTLVLLYFISTLSYLTLSEGDDATEEARLSLLVAGIVTCLFLCMCCCMLVR